MTNVELFLYSGENLEPIVDPYYNREKVVIPESASDTNVLVEKNARLIELITVFGYFRKQGKDRSCADVQKVVAEICEILVGTPGINLAPLSQFFMVYNSSYDSFRRYSEDERVDFLYEMLSLYVEKRHEMYLSHGYSNSILQVVCDNYSHKRNSKTTIVKVCDILSSYGFVRASAADELLSRRSFILPDKGDKGLFADFRRMCNVEMVSAKNEQNKLPDMVFGSNGEAFIVEMKSMKGSGGGQDKQLTEVINFIRHAEKNPDVHYISYLDGEYSNLLHGQPKSPKIRCQYKDALSCLRNNPGNYFLNTAGFKRFLQEQVKVGSD